MSLGYSSRVRCSHGYHPMVFNNLYSFLSYTLNFVGVSPADVLRGHKYIHCRPGQKFSIRNLEAGRPGIRECMMLRCRRFAAGPADSRKKIMKSEETILWARNIKDFPLRSTMEPPSGCTYRFLINILRYLSCSIREGRS